jgi:hypothetical protein
VLGGGCSTENATPSHTQRCPASQRVCASAATGQPARASAGTEVDSRATGTVRSSDTVPPL